MLNERLSQVKDCWLCADLWIVKCQDTETFICCYLDDYPDWDQTSEDNHAPCAIAKASAGMQNVLNILCILISLRLSMKNILK